MILMVSVEWAGSEGSFIVSLRRGAVFSNARGGRPPLAGRGSALRFRAGRGLCRRVVKAMPAGKNPVTLTSYSSPEGRYHHPLNTLNPHAQRACPMAIPLFSKARGFRRLTAPGFKPPLGLRPWRLRFRPQSGLVQRELYMLPAAAPHERKRTQPFYTTCAVRRAPGTL